MTISNCRGKAITGRQVHVGRAQGVNSIHANQPIRRGSHDLPPDSARIGPGMGYSVQGESMSSVCGEAGRIYLERFCDSCSSFSVVDADEARGVEQEKHEDVPVCT